MSADQTIDQTPKEYTIKILPGPILHITWKPGLNGAKFTIQKINLDKKLAINMAFSLLREVVIESERRQ